MAFFASVTAHVQGPSSSTSTACGWGGLYHLSVLVDQRRREQQHRTEMFLFTGCSCGVTVYLYMFKKSEARCTHQVQAWNLFQQSG